LLSRSFVGAIVHVAALQMVLTENISLIFSADLWVKNNPAIRTQVYRMHCIHLDTSGYGKCPEPAGVTYNAGQDTPESPRADGNS
jgi:hypothetical protein